MRHGAMSAMTFGSVPPIKAVSYDTTPGSDVGRYLIVFEDAPPPGDDREHDVDWLCMHCLIDEFPEVGPALEMAREIGERLAADCVGDEWPTGEVWWVDGRWVPLDDVADEDLR